MDNARTRIQEIVWQCSDIAKAYKKNKDYFAENTGKKVENALRLANEIADICKLDILQDFGVDEDGKHKMRSLQALMDDVADGWGEYIPITDDGNKFINIIARYLYRLWLHLFMQSSNLSTQLGKDARWDIENEILHSDEWSADVWQFLLNKAGITDEEIEDALKRQSEEQPAEQTLPATKPDSAPASTPQTPLGMKLKFGIPSLTDEVINDIVELSKYEDAEELIIGYIERNKEVLRKQLKGYSPKLYKILHDDYKIIKKPRSTFLGDMPRQQ